MDHNAAHQTGSRQQSRKTGASKRQPLRRATGCSDRTAVSRTVTARRFLDQQDMSAQTAHPAAPCEGDRLDPPGIDAARGQEVLCARRALNAQADMYSLVPRSSAWHSIRMRYCGY